MRRDDHDLRRRRDLLDLARRLDPRHPALEHDVHQDHVGEVLGGQLDRRLRIVDGRGDHLQSVVEPDDRRQGVREDLVVIADQQRRHRAPTSPLHRKPNGEHRTPGRAVGDRSVAPVCPGDRAAEVQAQSGPRAVLVARRSPGGEPVEDDLPLRRRDPRSSVAHLDRGLVSVAPEAPPRSARREARTSRRCPTAGAVRTRAGSRRSRPAPRPRRRARPGAGPGPFRRPFPGRTRRRRADAGPSGSSPRRASGRPRSVRPSARAARTRGGSARGTRGARRRSARRSGSGWWRRGRGSSTRARGSRG